MTPAEGPDATVGAMVIGGASVLLLIVAFVALLQLRDWCDEIGQRKADAAAHTATKTKTWADLLPTAKDEARMVARVAEGLENVRTWPPVRKSKLTPLADHRRKHGAA